MKNKLTVNFDCSFMTKKFEPQEPEDSKWSKKEISKELILGGKDCVWLVLEGMSEDGTLDSLNLHISAKDAQKNATFEVYFDTENGQAKIHTKGAFSIKLKSFALEELKLHNDKHQLVIVGAMYFHYDEERDLRVKAQADVAHQQSDSRTIKTKRYGEACHVIPTLNWKIS